MANQISIPSGLQATAVITGAMMSLSLTTIPLFLDTNTQSAHMLSQWVRLYHYGHLLLPSMAVATCLIYGYLVFSKRASGKPWITYAVAGAVTVTMIPFTWIVMVPTNNTLFRLNDEIKVAVPALDHVQELVKGWGRLHAFRSLFPLVGAILGFSGLLNNLAI
ncbi:hypothetical protein LTR66_004969 [Elasticomyces elasticus]|nr:hypothetical protein LTR66_004969 [Elasticomyces elasticus]